MATSVGEVFADATTTITSLGGALAGCTSDALGDYVIGALQLHGSGLGGAGMAFCVRAAVSAVMYTTVVRLMPETSTSVVFPFLYFAGDRKLIATGVTVAQLSINIVLAMFKGSPTAMAATSCCNGKAASAKCDECSH